MRPAEERRLLRRIAARAFVAPTAVKLNRLDIERDVAAVHANTPLRLAALLGAHDLYFFREILGITSSRKAGTLASYTPHFAQRPAQRRAA